MPRPRRRNLHIPFREKAEPQPSGWRRIGEWAYLIAAGALFAAGLISAGWSTVSYATGFLQ